MAPNERDTMGLMRNRMLYIHLLQPKIFLFCHANGSEVPFPPGHSLFKAEMRLALASPLWLEMSAYATVERPGIRQRHSVNMPVSLFLSCRLYLLVC